MKLVMLTRPDNGPVWINPEQVVRVSHAERRDGHNQVEITLVSGMQVVVGNLVEIVSKLSG